MPLQGDRKLCKFCIPRTLPWARLSSLSRAIAAAHRRTSAYQALEHQDPTHRFSPAAFSRSEKYPSRRSLPSAMSSWCLDISSPLA